ncbi:MAG: hypothetical protein PHU33_16000 [Bacteroidales bacterium]|nr:hypothetical protein [Bacteroidales bacterium]
MSYITYSVIDNDFARMEITKASKRAVAAGGNIATGSRTVELQLRLLKAAGLWDQAVLVMLPALYAPNKLLSLKGPDFTVSRATKKYIRDWSGYYYPVSANLPGIEFDQTLQHYIVKSEVQRTTLVMRSHEFDNAYWSKQNTSVEAGFSSVFLDNQFGGMKLIESATVGSHYLAASVFGLTVGIQVTLYAIVKKAGRSYVMLSDDNVGYNSQGLFNLATAQVAGGGAASKFISYIADDYYLIGVTYTTTGTGIALRIFLHSGSGVTYQGDGVSGVYICHAQVVTTSIPGSPIVAEGSTVTSLADSITVTIPDQVTKIITTINNVDVFDNAPVPGATYTLPAGNIDRVLMLK